MFSGDQKSTKLQIILCTDTWNCETCAGCHSQWQLAHIAVKRNILVEFVPPKQSITMEEINLEVF